MDMNSELLFSVVVAACNVEKYVGKTIDSLKAQTYTDFEALIVAEESTDGTEELCRKQTEGDDRFLVVARTRSGSPSAPRNYGIETARGKYIVFIDGDDWIEPDSLEKFAAALERYGDIDILMCALKECFEAEDGGFQFTRRLSNLTKLDEGRIFTGFEVVTRIGEYGEKPMAQVFLSIYRTAFLREHADLRMVPGIMHEDTQWTPRVWFYAQKVAVLDFAYYIYRRRPSSITTGSNPQLLMDLPVVLWSLLEFFHDHEYPAAAKKTWQNHWLSLFYWYFFHPQYQARFSKKVRREALQLMFKGDRARRYRKFAAGASFPKRPATPLALLAGRYGIVFPARFYFKFIYYPLIQWRDKKRDK